jgi:hypothetical protein
MAQRQIILQQPTKAFLRRQNFPREPDKKLSKKTYTVVSFFSDHANIHAIIHAKEKRANFIFSLKSDNTSRRILPTVLGYGQQQSLPVVRGC